MVSSASSRGVNAARRVSLLRRLIQYLQSKAQTLVISTFSSVMQRPSAEKLWQHPAMEEVVLPIMPALAPRCTPLEVQAASYLAASVRIVSFSRTFMLLRRAASAAGRRMVDAVDEPHYVGSNRTCAQQGNEQSDRRHYSYLHIKLMFYLHYKSNRRSCQHKSNKISTYFSVTVDRRPMLY